jgi:hypothetical protein
LLFLLALVAWFWLLTVEMKDEKEKKMRYEESAQEEGATLV